MCAVQLLLDLLTRAAGRTLVTEICAPAGSPLIRLDEGLGQLGRHLLERGAGVGGEMLAVCLERVPRQLQAQLPGDSIGRGLQKVGPGAEQLKPGEEVLTAYPRKWFDVAEALVGDEAAGVCAGGRRASLEPPLILFATWRAGVLSSLSTACDILID